MTGVDDQQSLSGASLSNSRIEPSALVTMVEEAYDLTSPISCSWIRRGFNDHYLVQTPSGKWVLRVYLNHKYWISGPEDFLYELELLRFVRAEGVSVAAPVPQRDGALLGAIDTDAGVRYCALFEFAEGSTRGDVTVAHGRLVGRTLAEFHRAADRFRPSQPSYGRYSLDLRYLLDQPLELLDEFLTGYGRPGLERFDAVVDQMRQQVLQLDPDGGSYGPIHGDPHRGNWAVTNDGQVRLFDFDHGGFGWRGYDLAVATWRGARGGWASRIEAYESVRPLSDQERHLLPLFRKLNAIWDLGDLLAMRPAWGPEEEFGEKFAERAEKRLSQVLSR